MDELPRTGAHRTLAGNRFFDLIEEEIEDRAGRMYPYYTISSKWDAVVVVPLLPDGRLLVERIYRHPVRAWLYEFPAGGIEPDEDPCAAGARELREETGFTAERLTLLHAYEALPGLLRLRLHLVLAEGLRDGGQRDLEAAEFIEVEHRTVAEAWELATRQPTSSFLVMGLLALARRLSDPSA